MCLELPLLYLSSVFYSIFFTLFLPSFGLMIFLWIYFISFFGKPDVSFCWFILMDVFMFIVYIFNFSQFIFKSYYTTSHIIKNYTLYLFFSPQIFMLLLVYVLLLHVINDIMDFSHLCFKQLILFQRDLIMRLYIHPHNTSSDNRHSLV